MFEALGYDDYPPQYSNQKYFSDKLLVWLDGNNNGLFDAGESGIPGVQVILEGAGADGTFGSDDDITATKTTNARGHYRFLNLAGGDYKVSLGALPGGLNYAMPNVGGNEGIDSDINPSTGTTDVITLAPSQVNSKVDIGLV